MQMHMKLVMDAPLDIVKGFLSVHAARIPTPLALARPLLIRVCLMSMREFYGCIGNEL